MFSGKVAQWLHVGRASLFAGLLAGNVSTLLLAGRPRAALSFLQYQLFGWRMISGSGLPQIQFHELFQTPDTVTVDLLPATGEYIQKWDANYAKDMVYLALLAAVLKPQSVFEIGTLEGYTALLFALNLNEDGLVHTLDLPRERVGDSALKTTVVDDQHIDIHSHTTQYLYQSHDCGHRVRQLSGDSATFDFSPYHESVDLFFIDGAHSFEYVKSDSERAFSCVREGGVIAWHDYGRWGVNGVSRYLHGLARQGMQIYRFPGSSMAVHIMGSQSRSLMETPV